MNGPRQNDELKEEAASRAAANAFATAKAVEATEGEAGLAEGEAAKAAIEKGGFKN